MYTDAIETFVPSEIMVKPAVHAWEIEEAQRLRRAVFCIEQGLFSGDDQDALDRDAQPLVAATCMAGMPDQVVGTVRIHTSEQGVWWGSRLAVHPAFRSQSQVGSSLIRLAVGLAALEGAHAFYAHVQIQNVPLFEKLHWTLLAQVQLHGRTHGLMQAQLGFYPPEARFRDGIVLRTRGRR